MVPSIGKIIDKILLDQLIVHLHSNELIPHQHHGRFNHKSTVTALTTLIDIWSNSLESGKEAVALVMDQLKAFDVINHGLLNKKLNILGLDKHSLRLMESYLDNRTQVVFLEGFTSSTLNTGMRSVIQEYRLSCALYLVYTMDLPLIFEERKLTVRETELSDRPDSQTYIDNNLVTVNKIQNEDIQVSLLNTIHSVEEYMAANLLRLNPEKTNMMVLSKDIHTRNRIRIPAEPTDIIHSKHLKVLGIDIDQDLNWKYFLIDGEKTQFTSNSSPGSMPLNY